MRLAALALLVAIGLGAYGLAGQLLGGFDLRDLRAMLRRRAALPRAGGSAITPPAPR